MSNNSIRMVIDFSKDPGSCEVAIHVTTEAFEPQETDDHLGAAWVGFCKAINEYMQKTGSPDFNCMKAQWEM